MHWHSIHCSCTCPFLSRPSSASGIISIFRQPPSQFFEVITVGSQPSSVSYFIVLDHVQSLGKGGIRCLHTVRHRINIHRTWRVLGQNVLGCFQALVQILMLTNFVIILKRKANLWVKFMWIHYRIQCICLSISDLKVLSYSFGLHCQTVLVFTAEILCW